MGTVFLGEHTLIGRRAAIKVLLPELSSKRESVDRFFNEARATIAISDPGIVQIFDFGFTPENIAYIVMELLEGEQLNVRLSRLGSLPPADALRITRQAAGSLGAAHTAGIVHRDLKPENLYIVRDPEAPGGERPKILDFGIAKLSAEAPDRVRTRTGALMGTPVYMSPEQCDGAGKVDHRADIYALGCVLFHLLTGRPPFDLPGVGAVISAHMREQAPAPSSLVPQLPAGVDELMARCLAKSPDARFASMLELQAACDVVLARITGSGAMRMSGSMLIPLSPRPLTESDARTSGAIPMSPMQADSILSGSMLVPLLTPRPLSEPDPRPTTLGTSVGQPVGIVPPRRVGRWIAVALLAGGIGATIAMVTSRSSARDPSRSAARELPTLPGAPIDAGTTPAVITPPPPPPTQPPANPIAPAAVADAGVPAADAGAHVEPPTHPKPPPVISRPPPQQQQQQQQAAGKPKPKPTPTPNNDDLYDDRN